MHSVALFLWSPSSQKRVWHQLAKQLLSEWVPFLHGGCTAWLAKSSLILWKMQWSQRKWGRISPSLITPEDQSLNQIGENCSLRGSSKEKLSRGVTKLANSIWDSTLTKKRNIYIETKGLISKQFKGMCYICLPSVANTNYVATLLEEVGWTSRHFGLSERMTS